MPVSMCTCTCVALYLQVLSLLPNFKTFAKKVKLIDFQFCKYWCLAKEILLGSSLRISITLFPLLR